MSSADCIKLIYLGSHYECVKPAAEYDILCMYWYNILVLNVYLHIFRGWYQCRFVTLTRQCCSGDLKAIPDRAATTSSLR
jgi:hypothetical protein